MIKPDRIGNIKAVAGLFGAGALLTFMVWGQGEIEGKVYTPGDAARSVVEQYDVTNARAIDSTPLLPGFRGCRYRDSVRYMIDATTQDGTISTFRVCKSILPFEPSIQEEE